MTIPWKYDSFIAFSIPLSSFYYGNKYILSLYYKATAWSPFLWTDEQLDIRGMVTNFIALVLSKDTKDYLLVPLYKPVHIAN